MSDPRDLATRARRRRAAASAGGSSPSARRRWWWPLAAQVAVPVPFSPVPMTLQPLAVLAVGGLLGAAGGLAALILVSRARHCSGFRCSPAAPRAWCT